MTEGANVAGNGHQRDAPRRPSASTAEKMRSVLPQSTSKLGGRLSSLLTHRTVTARLWKTADEGFGKALRAARSV